MEDMKHRLPTRVRELAAASAFHDEDDSSWVTAKLHCPRCSQTQLTLLFHHDRDRMGDGGILLFAPVWVACEKCRYYTLLFDTASDGCNGLSSSEPIRIPESKVQPWNGAAASTYTVEVEYKYDEHVTEGVDKEVIHDWFSWLTIYAKDSNGRTILDLEFNTA